MSTYCSRLQPALQILLCCSVLPPKIVMHDDTYIGGLSVNNINASCMMISGGRTKQLDIFCCVTNEFQKVVELIRFFHGVIQQF